MGHGADLKVVTGEQMRSIEAAAVARGIGLSSLMEQAGTALARKAAELAGQKPVLFLVGPGNNGGDGLVAASRLHLDERQVSVYTYRRAETPDIPAPVVQAEQDPNRQMLDAWLGRSAVVVDALLGIGQSRAPEGLLADVLQFVNDRRPQGSVGLAADVPTGVNADTAAVPGAAFRADVTLAMGLMKVGDVVYPGAGYAGIVELADVGLPADLASDVTVSRPVAERIARLLPRREADSNKGTFGHLLIVGGSRNFSGAPAMTAVAAYRSGAGLVQAAIPSSIMPMVASRCPEAIFLPLPESEGRVTTAALDDVATGLGRATALVYGPGLGLDKSTVDLTRALLQRLGESGLPAVVDADGLNSLARLDSWWKHGGHLILTPHPGEMSRLTGLPVADIQSNRLEVCRRFAGTWGQVVILKGAGTIIASPDGRVSINPTGGPNLATAGAGDVLSGIIGGLLAQGLPPWEAAVSGVYWHGLAGDILRREHGDAGTLAGDLPPVLPRARRKILQDAGATR